MLPGVTVEHITAGPATEVPKDELLPHMAEFAHGLQGAWRRDRPDIVHAHFWMSGLASLDAAEPLGVPVVQTFHALGIVKRRHQGDADTSPPQRLEIEQRILRDADGIIATCSDEVFELLRIGANRRRVTVIPCGVDPAVFHPEGPAATRGREPRVLVLSRLVPRKGIDDVITAMADVPGAELVVAGGPDRDALAIDPEASRLRRLVRRLGLDRRVTFLGRV